MHVPPMKPALVLLSLVLGCAAPAHDATSAAPRSPAWLCRAGADEPCAHADLTAIDAADGSLDPSPPAGDRGVDCFYVYPTVDFDLAPHNTGELRAHENIVATAIAQVGRFRELCTLWVPLYRQATLGAFLQPPAERERLLAIAYTDIERAFREYLHHSEGRRIVLIGHSQGAEMVTRLLRQFFDADAALRARLLLAYAIGGWLEVAPGQTTGGSLAEVPVCSRPGETGCVVAYHLHAVGEPLDVAPFAPTPGHETACVDPSALDHGPHPLRRSYLPLRGPFAIRAEYTQPFVREQDAYESRCVLGPRGYRLLAVRALRDKGLIDLHDPRLRRAKLGLHVFDMQLPQGDLIELLRARL